MCAGHLTSLSLLVVGMSVVCSGCYSYSTQIRLKDKSLVGIATRNNPQAPWERKVEPDDKSPEKNVLMMEDATGRYQVQWHKGDDGVRLTCETCFQDVMTVVDRTGTMELTSTADVVVATKPKDGPELRLLGDSFTVRSESYQSGNYITTTTYFFNTAPLTPWSNVERVKERKSWDWLPIATLSPGILLTLVGGVMTLGDVDGGPVVFLLGGGTVGFAIWQLFDPYTEERTVYP